MFIVLSVQNYYPCIRFYILHNDFMVIGNRVISVKCINNCYVLIYLHIPISDRVLDCPASSLDGREAKFNLTVNLAFGGRQRGAIYFQA